KLSGPLLDRIDLQIPVPRLKPEELAGLATGESSAVVARRVLEARQRQAARQARQGLVVLNAHLSPRELRQHAELDADSQKLLTDAARAFGLSARAFDKIIRVARTIADLDAVDRIASQHVAEAIQYRTIDPFATA
ncbi:MAG TPA: magnesium chelatase, partial [Candidatus Ozemobacteraceae bacterium]|nr:magnesium chelatase [Candidatus Ozemobacteraceae bacterium]